MPEMNDFVGDGQGKHNYLTQDEAGNNSRMAQLGHNKRRNRPVNDSGVES